MLGLNKFNTKDKDEFIDIVKKINWSEIALPIVIVLLSVYFYSVNHNFFSIMNFQNIGRQSSILAMLAIGQGVVIICGGIDLSQGALMALSSLIGADIMVKYGMWEGVIVCLLVGTLVGTITGIICSKGKIPPFVVTLGLMTALRGLTFLYTGGFPVTGLPIAFKSLGFGTFGPIPFVAILTLLFFGFAAFFLKWSKIGRYFYAIGGNESTAILSGINVDNFKIISFAISGLMASIAGLIMTSRIVSGQPTIGEGMALLAIASCVIGGVSLKGGRGNAIGVFFGVLILSLIANGLNLMRVSSFTQMVVNGFIIIVAVFFDQYSRKD